ncbi:MAG: GNAT family N-acetyltransferase, partial [Pseudomonadales bacterium]|nr:GNAT family N-acetyltransferase [Pseudomonadales bacterium]
VGRRLFEALLEQVRTAHPEILRVELIASASNRRAISLYTSLGFEQEGEMRGRIRTPEGGFESDIPMAWHRS